MIIVPPINRFSVNGSCNTIMPINAAITLSILNGEKGVKRDAVLLNAGAALYIGEKAKSIQEGINLAARLIDSKKALKVLEDFIKVSNE